MKDTELKSEKECSINQIVWCDIPVLDLDRAIRFPPPPIFTLFMLGNIMRNIYVFVFFMLIVNPLFANSQMPAEISKAPRNLIKQANIIFSGTYTEGRSPCIFRPDGSRTWFLLEGFKIENIYKGKMTRNYIGIESEISAKKHIPKYLIEGHSYLVLLKIDLSTQKKLERNKDEYHYENVLGKEEIIAIVELKSKIS